jgi:hypothetical protein
MMMGLFKYFVFYCIIVAIYIIWVLPRENIWKLSLLSGIPCCTVPLPLDWYWSICYFSFDESKKNQIYKTIIL